jgi:hypothetical protein
MEKGCLFDNIPHEQFEGDMTICRMTPREVHALADKLLKQGFAELKQKYCNGRKANEK